MDMHEPNPAQLNANDSDRNPAEATDTASEAGIKTQAGDFAADPEGQAEILQTQALEEQQQNNDQRQQHAEHTIVTEESLLQSVLELLEKEPSEFSSDDINRLRQKFSMLHSENAAVARPAGDDTTPADEQPEIEPDDNGQPTLRQQFDAAIAELRARKAAWAAKLQEERAANLARKNDIIARISALAEDTDNVNRTFPRYRELQDEFNAIGEVDPTEETALWKRFQEAREQYSDNLKINKELRDYDFKKNLAEKEALLAEARTLAMDDDVIAAYRRLQDLHNKWRQIGPVAKELRDDIWNRFREASAEINKRYQAFFEERKAREAENETAKTTLCERLEAIDFATMQTFNAWEQATKQVMELQAEWRTLGFASKKANRQLFARFRSRCDAFFAAKADFFRNTREELSANLARKQQLAAEAEELAQSTDWKKTTDRLVEMQKEWRTIGAVPKKYSDALWKRFTTACDAFFENKKKAGNSTRQTETANLKAKREIIGKLSALTTDGSEKAQALDAMRELQNQWNQTGHVPFREKDKLFEAYRDALDAVRRHFDLAERGARREKFSRDIEALEGDGDKLFRERDRIMRIVEARRAELRTYQNNLGFLTSKSKSGDSLVRDMERRIERLQADIDELLEKVKVLDARIPR
jgi:hypothetical protein